MSVLKPFSRWMPHYYLLVARLTLICILLLEREKMVFLEIIPPLTDLRYITWVILLLVLLTLTLNLLINIFKYLGIHLFIVMKCIIGGTGHTDAA